MRRVDAALCAWALLLAGLFLRAGWHGGPGVPLDDPYIYFDYARTAAAGHWLQYNPGDPATSGATSLLWLALLTVGRWLGVRGAGMLWWDFGLSAACVAFGAPLYRRAATRLGLPDWAAAALAAAGCATGAVAFALWGGLEAPLTYLALGALAEALTAGAARRAVLLAALLPAVRPDVAAAVAFLMVVRRPWSPLGLLPAAALGAYAWVMRVWTGTAVMAGGSAKLLLLAPGNRLAFAGTGLVGAAASLASGWDWIAPYGHLVVAAVAGSLLLFGLALLGRRGGLTGLAVVGLALEGMAFGPATPTYQFGRYLAPYAPLLVLAAGAGAQRLSFGRHAPAVLLGLALAGLPSWVGRFHTASAQIAEQQVAVARWIDRHLPPQAVVVVNDAGAMAYYGHRYTVDGMGIATRGLAADARAPGQPAELAGVLRFLAKRGLGGRPLYAAIYSNWLPALAAAGVPVKAFRLPGSPLIDERTVEILRLP